MSVSEYFAGEDSVMTARPPVVAMLVLLGLWGCSQASGPVPSATQSMVEHSGGGADGKGPAVEFFDTPSSGSWPGYIVAGPQKALWFTEEFTGNIGRITTDGTITEFSDSNGVEAEGITAGRDGNLWFTEPGANEIGRMTPQGVVKLFQINGSNPSPRGIASGPDGNLWSVEFYDGYLDRITPQGAITRFQVPVYSPGVWAITTGPDGDLWFTESEADAIGRFNPRTLKFDAAISVPTPTSTPWAILLTPDKHIWITERTGDKIAEIDGLNNVHEFPIAQPGSYPEDLTRASNGELWFTESQTGALGRFNPATGKFGRIITLPANSIPNAIATGANGNAFFTIDSYSNPSAIGEVLLH